MDHPTVNLLGIPQGDLERMFVGMGEKPFRARQVMQWLYGRSVFELDGMTNLSVALRQELSDRVRISLPEIQARDDSEDGVVKWRLKAGGGQVIETVFIPEDGRGTLCVSSQVGCAMDCPFCATGRQGFNRNLAAAEIIGQVIIAARELGPRRISNVVFMGMGEPLANLRAVVQATDILVDDLGFGLSRRRVTVSTSGLVPQIRRLAEAVECRAWLCHCTRRTMNCVTSSCRLTGAIRSLSYWTFVGNMRRLPGQKTSPLNM